MPPIGLSMLSFVADLLVDLFEVQSVTRSVRINISLPAISLFAK
jgi:hypothetical protein